MHDDRQPMELDDDLAWLDDDRPPRTLRRRLAPLIWLVALVTLVGLVLLSL